MPARLEVGRDPPLTKRKKIRQGYPRIPAPDLRESSHRGEALLTNAIDLFAGPGGWEEAAAGLGFRPLGIELDEAACATRETAGHRTLRADVAALEPRDFAPCELLIASPPCQAFSMAGKRGGARDVPLIFQACRDLLEGRDTRAELRERCADERSLLVVEPLRWALALRLSRIALEQVPPVLAVWQWFADALRLEGWKVWTGLLSAERYGVPQTRERAFLMASLAGSVSPPAPTHQRYEPGVGAAEQHTLEGTLLPWVSMAEALGWNDESAVNIDRSGDRAAEQTQATEPSPTVTARARRWHGVDVPAPTVTAGGGAAGGPEPFAGGGQRVSHRSAVVDADGESAIVEDSLSVPWTLHTNRDQREDGSRQTRPAPAPAPAPALTGKSGGQWYVERPAVTVAGDPRLGSPGHRDRDGGERQFAESIRVTLEEAAVLQGFRRDYPFQGSRTKRFEQVGNAVPPPLAGAVLAALLEGK